jgi:hypothetical protein
MKFIKNIPHLKIALFYILLVLAAFFAGGTSIYYKTFVGQAIKDALNGVEEWQKEAEVEQVEMEEMEKQKNSKVTVALLKYREGTYPGFTLFTTHHDQKARLLDMKGNIVHQWEKPFNEAFPKPDHVTKPRGRIHWSDARLFPNGDLIVQYHGALDTPYGYGLVKMDKNSTLIWNYRANTHHTFDIGEDGRIYGLSQKWYKKPINGFPFIKPPALLDSIYVLSPDGKELSTVDIIDTFRDTPYKDLLRITDPVWRALGDYFHTNSISVLRNDVKYSIPGVKPGMVLVSIRNPDVLCIIDIEKRRTVWASRGPWKQQHSAYFTPDGMISVYDNQGWGKRRTRVMEFDPLTLKETWSFPKRKEDYFYSNIRGRSALLPNGNVTIAKSNDGHIIEVNRNSRALWEVKVEREYQNGETVRQIVSTGLRYTKEELPFMSGIDPLGTTSPSTEENNTLDEASDKE